MNRSSLACGAAWRSVAWAAVLSILLASRASAQQPSWEEIGPFNVGGRVSALAVDPQNPAHVIVGTPAGGLWQTHNGGATWSGLSLWLASVPVSAIAFDAADPRRIFVGTGALADNGAVQGGIGLIATTDGGATWAMREIGAQGAYISAIVVWPGDPARVVVGTDLGIRLSVDGGMIYGAVLDGQAVSAMAVDPLNVNVMYASGRGGLLHSLDRGATWTLASAWPLEASDEFGAGTTALAVSATNAGVLYASVQVLGTFNSTARALLLRSTNGGQSFTALPAPGGLCPEPQTCGFAHALAVDPSNDNRLLVGGEQLYSSTNAGATWQLVGGSLQGVHQLSLSAGRNFAAGRFGVAEINAGWTNTQRRNEGLAVTAIHSIDVASGPEPRLLAATRDSGTLLATGASPIWKVAFGSGEPAGPARFDPFDPAALFASKTRGRLFRSIDFGATFAAADQNLDLTQPAAEFAPVTPSLHEPGTWYTGRLQTFASTDGGASWNPFRPPGFPEIGLIAASPASAGRVYFATQQGGDLYKADGDTTDRLVVSTESDLRLSSLFLDPQAQNRLYVAGTNTARQAGRVFKSADFGASWLDVTPPGLPAATSILKDAFGALYVGSRDGVWRSANDGFTWTPFVNGLFAGGVDALQRGGGWLYAGTTGRGMFRIRELPLVSVESTPPGVTFLVDGQEVTGPFLAYWDTGSLHTITPVLRNTADVREEFLGWSDGAAQARTVTATDANSWVMAAIKRSFKLSAAATPASGGTVTFSPASPDGFYAERSFVTVIPVPADDHRVSGFSGQISGDDGLVAFALMDRARSVVARFEPLRMTVNSDPSGIPIVVDGTSLPTPVTHQWKAGSTHSVSAPEYVGTSLYEPVLAFDEWSDLRLRTHNVLLTRDTFVTDLKAKYISTIRGVSVPAHGARTVITRGTGEAARMAALTLNRDGDSAGLAALQFVRGNVGGQVTTELALVPSIARTWTNVVIEQDVDGKAGRARISAYNPTAVDAPVGILFRNTSGGVQAAKLDALVVGAGAHVTAWLDELMQLPPSFTSLLTLISPQPLVTSVHSWRRNVRPTHVHDPIIVAPFTQGDAGVPLDARVQVALVTPDTTHRLVVVNTGFSPLTGTIAFRDTAGAPTPVFLPGGPQTQVTYTLAPGAFDILEFTAPATGNLTTLQILVTPAAGLPAPALQMLEERRVGEVNGSLTMLPRSLPPSTPATLFRVPVNRAQRETGVVFTNTSPFTINLTIRVLGGDGVERLTTSRIVQPRAQTTVSTDDIAASLGAAFQGWLSIGSAIPIHAVGYLRFSNGRDEEILAGFPASADQPVATLPLAIDGDSWRSEWSFINASAATAKSLLDFRGRLGATVHFPVE
jgi:hypothetical protein